MGWHCACERQAAAEGSDVDHDWMESPRRQLQQQPGAKYALQAALPDAAECGHSMHRAAYARQAMQQRHIRGSRQFAPQSGCVLWKVNVRRARCDEMQAGRVPEPAQQLEQQTQLGFDHQWILKCGVGRGDMQLMGLKNRWLRLGGGSDRVSGSGLRPRRKLAPSRKSKPHGQR
jgi:hypothetical protein